MVIGFVMPGGTEWMFIVLLAILLFGANKLPKLAQSAGSALGEFKKARYTAEQEVQEVKNDATGDMEELERDVAGPVTNDNEEMETD